jgi:hypothetical protein
MPRPLNVPITPPRVPIIDERSGQISREWYMFFLSLFQSVGGSGVSLDDLQKGPPTVTVDEVDHAVERANRDIKPSTESAIEQIAELRKQIDALQVVPQQVVQLLSQLADVSALNPSDGDKLIYNGALGKWEQDSRSYLMLE